MRLASLGVALLTAVVVVVPRSAVGRAPAVRVSISPARAFVDQPVRIRASGLRARQTVTMQATTHDFLGAGWRSAIKFRADRKGVVDTHRSMRLFWLMQPTKANTPGFALQRGYAPITVRVVSGNRTLARGTLMRRSEDPALVATDTTLASQGFVGTYLAKPSATPAPAVLQLGGSAGGHSRLPAAVLASHGYPTLSLAYFGEDGLPSTLENIPLEYFAKALRWLGSQPGVDPGRITILGVSRGAEAALLVTAAYPDLARGVIACTPNQYVLPASSGSGAAWTLGGKAIKPGEPYAVEKIAGPVLVFGAGQDAFGRSSTAVDVIQQRAKAHNLHNITGRVYPAAGHAVGCQLPNLPIGDYFVSPGITQSRGGTPDSNGRAAAQAWPLVLHFLYDV